MVKERSMDSISRGSVRKKRFPYFTKRDSTSSVLCNVATPKSNKGIISSWSDIGRRPS